MTDFSALIEREMNYTLALDGKTPVPVADTLTWARDIEGLKASGRFRVGWDYARFYSEHLGYVSTVFLGLDHSFFSGPPVLWETMVFGGPLADEQERYITWEDALLGHHEMLRRCRSVPLWRELWCIMRDAVIEAMTAPPRQRMYEFARRLKAEPASPVYLPGLKIA